MVEIIMTILGDIFSGVIILVGVGLLIWMYEWTIGDKSDTVMTSETKFNFPDKIVITIEHEDAPKDTAENPSEQTSVAKTPDDTTA